MYEPYLQRSRAFLYMELPPWILAKEITDNWRTSAWGRISGFTLPIATGRRRSRRPLTVSRRRRSPAPQSKLDVFSARSLATLASPCTRKSVCYNFLLQRL